MRLHHLLSLTIALLASASITPATAFAAPVEDSVVKIFSTMRYPDLFKPWTKQAPSESTGSGVIIAGNRILTNAHVVLYASQIQVQANQSGDKFLASVEHIAPGIDLAILKLDDEQFFNNRPALALDTNLPSIKDTVMAYGFPAGGSTLSITKGIVSRIEYTSYNRQTAGLRIQIDAAINPGNSGGPTLRDDKMIGLAFSRYTEGDNIGYIIPAEEIQTFLNDINDGKYNGKPNLFDEFQTLDNPALRPFLKLPKNAEGMIVTRTINPSPDYLQPWDLITHIGDTPIDNEGMIKLKPDLRVSFLYLLKNYTGTSTAPLTVIRNGISQKIQAPLLRSLPRLLEDLDGEYPPYFIYGPIVFSVATPRYAAAYAKNALGIAYDDNPLITRVGDTPAFPSEELVLIPSPFFPHKLTKGYDNPSVGIVESINGTPVKNLRHLIELLRDTKSEFIILKLAGRSRENYVFPRREMESSTEEILNDNGIRAQSTPALQKIWDSKPQ